MSDNKRPPGYIPLTMHQIGGDMGKPNRRGGRGGMGGGMEDWNGNSSDMGGPRGDSRGGRDRRSSNGRGGGGGGGRRRDGRYGQGGGRNEPRGDQGYSGPTYNDRNRARHAAAGRAEARPVEQESPEGGEGSSENFSEARNDAAPADRNNGGRPYGQNRRSHPPRGQDSRRDPREPRRQADTSRGQGEVGEEGEGQRELGNDDRSEGNESRGRGPSRGQRGQFAGERGAADGNERPRRSSEPASTDWDEQGQGGNDDGDGDF